MARERDDSRIGFTQGLFQADLTSGFLGNAFLCRPSLGQSAEFLHKFVTVFDTKAESVAFSVSAETRSARASGAAPAAPAGGAQSDWGRGCGNYPANTPKLSSEKPAPRAYVLQPEAERCAALSLASAPGRALSVGLALLAALSASGMARAADPTRIAVPSGQEITLSEVLLDEAPGELWARFRFVAPAIRAGGQGESAGDIDHLCTALARPYLSHHGLAPARVVISLASREVPFGSSAGDVTQFFETYRLEGETCVWEGF